MMVSRKIAYMARVLVWSGDMCTAWSSSLDARVLLTPTATRARPNKDSIVGWSKRARRALRHSFTFSLGMPLGVSSSDRGTARSPVELDTPFRPEPPLRCCFSVALPAPLSPGPPPPTGGAGGAGPTSRAASRPATCDRSTLPRPATTRLKTTSSSGTLDAAAILPANNASDRWRVCEEADDWSVVASTVPSLVPLPYSNVTSSSFANDLYDETDEVEFKWRDQAEAMERKQRKSRKKAGKGRS
mmetsp:Transcript_13131/g.41395  ORF Transcript_13131/g.41395 Transcript_13131/m.41395 type:complete len:244 (+) Transcript_13131:190-921(+)